MNTKTQTFDVRPGKGATFLLAFGRVRTMFLTVAIFAALGIATSVRADRVGHDVAAGYVIVDQIPGWPRDANDVDDNTNALLTLNMAVNNFRLQQNATASGWNRGDYRVRIGDSELDDVANGVLISSVAQNQRNNYGTNAMETSGVAAYGDGHWEVVSWNCPMVSTATANQGEANVNFGAAYFPYSSWIGGVARNSVNGGVFDNFIGSPGLVMGTHFIDAFATNSTMDGVAILDLTSFGIDSRRDGVLLVNAAKNEANFGMSKANTNDGTWFIYSHDNRANGQAWEQDPLCFVFVPKSNTNVISGKFKGDGTALMYSGTTPQFTVINVAAGRWTLKVTGGSATNGVLIVSPEGGESVNGDNIVTYQPTANNDGWEIQSRDLPACGLQTPTAPEPVASFVYIPVELPGATVTPTNGLVTYEDGRSAQFTVKISGSPKPTSDVTVTLTSSDTTEGTVSPSTLTFTPADWNNPQTVTVTGVDDLDPDGPQTYTINLSALSSADPRYNGFVPASVSVLNNDNETGISFDAASITTTEAGATATYTAVLNAVPAADVTLNLSSSDTTEAIVSPASLTFTAGDWNVPQTITVTGQDDFIVDGNISYTIVGSTVSTDPLNNGVSANMPGINLDNDHAGVVIPAAPLTISESNTTATFTAVLTSQPADFVTVRAVSGDTTEGTVSPATVIFTPDNWNVPRTFTVTAVDDFIPDGPISFLITNTVETEDVNYSGLTLNKVAVTTLDNEPVVTLPFGEVVYGLGEPPTALDGWATIVDLDTANYNGGSLVVTISAGATSNDRLAVRNIGTGPGQVGFATGTVSFEGTAVGTASGGTGATPLTISFNSASSVAAAQAVLRAVAYNNVDAAAPASTRTLTVALTDGRGGSASPVTKALRVRMLRVYSFQQDLDIGFGPYQGAGDVQIHQDFPTTSYPAGYSATAGMWIDWVNSSLLGQPQVLLRFNDLFGSGPGQIPAGAKIVSAEVILDISDNGDGMRLNRMLGDWDPNSATFDTFGGDGITLDDIEAVSGTNAFLGDPAVSTTTGTGYRSIGVTRDVQAWFNGTNNYGWVMSPWIQSANGNGTGFRPCEATNLADRPRLLVKWLPAGTSAALFRQGADGYTGAVDTQIRQSTPDTAYATAATLSPDAAAGTAPDPQQVLIRFDNIIGSGAGQVPPGATVHAAVLEMTSITSDSQGDGGEFHAILKPWNPTNTWNVWVDGIAADGIEAAVAATTSIGPSDTTQPPVPSTVNTVDLTSDVQAWVLGMQNNGWVILPWTAGNDGWGIVSSDAAAVDYRPQLRVYYEPGFMVLTVVHNGSNVQLTFSGKVGQTYSVVRSASLVTPLASWTALPGTATVGGGGTGTFTDNSPLPNGGYYRVRYP